MAKIVITGGVGFIGSHIAEVIVSDHEVVIVDNLNPNRLPSLRHYISGEVIC